MANITSLTPVLRGMVVQTALLAEERYLVVRDNGAGVPLEMPRVREITPQDASDAPRN